MVTLGREVKGRATSAVDCTLGRSASQEDGRGVAGFRPGGRLVQGRQALGRSSVGVGSRREDQVDKDYIGRSARRWITALCKVVSLLKWGQTRRIYSVLQEGSLHTALS